MLRSHRLCSVAVITLTWSFAWSALAQDNVEGPWGQPNGDNFGRARSDVIPLRFGTGTGARQAWRIPLRSMGSDRPRGRSAASMVFDAAGNSYWISDNAAGNFAKLSSASPAGALRWNARNMANTGDYDVGSVFDRSSPVVGAARVYVLGMGTGYVGGDSTMLDPQGRPALAAFNKATGALIWQRFLPEFANVWTNGESGAPAPILYNGKLYVFGAYDITNLFGSSVYQIDAATGAIDWQSTISYLSSNNAGSGTMAFVPDIFVGNPNPGSRHGLFVQNVSGSGTDGQGEMLGISIDPTPGTGGAALVWQSDGGFVARKHVIYSPVTNRLYTHTWNDYGASLYSFNPVTGAVIANHNAFNDGHGFFDVGSLGWNNTSVIAGGFSGNIIRYSDDGTGTTTDQIYKFTTEDCAPNWFGEPRNMGQLLRDKVGNSVLITGTNSRVNPDSFDPLCPARGPGPYPDLTSRLIVCNVDKAFDAKNSQDGPAYIDSIEILQGPNSGSLTPVYTENFESFSLGNVVGQNGWLDDSAPPSGAGTTPTIINDPTGMGHGKVLKLDANGNGGGWTGAYFPLTTPVDPINGATRVIRWRQWRADLTDNLWTDSSPSANYSQSWTLQWDVCKCWSHTGFGDSDNVPLTAGVWQTLTLTYDVNAGTIVLDVDGVPSGTPDVDIGYVFSSIDFELEGTARTTNLQTNRAMVAYDTGINFQNAGNLCGGPLAGPDGKIYYHDRVNGDLVAIEPIFLKGDANCDGAVNAADAPALITALLQGEPGYLAAYPGCSFLAGCDYNNDFLVDGEDIAAFWAYIFP